MVQHIMLGLALGCTPKPQPSADTPPASDTGRPWDPDASIYDNCFDHLDASGGDAPDYDQFGLEVGRHCSGTDHQDIEGIERLVFLGDSITAGTPPTPEDEVYRALLTRRLEDTFGPLEVISCAAWGARTDDLLLEPHQQIHSCMPEPDPQRTLVIMTVGGNDMFAFAEDLNEGGSLDELAASVDHAASLYRDALMWFSDNEATHFPGGVDVISANVYEYTDATGDLNSCPAAKYVGFDGDIPQMRSAYIEINERFAEISAETQTDMVFMLEHFCGHGFHAEDPTNECYRGPDEAEVWFDATCIHPNPAGHQALSDFFFDIVRQ